MNWTELVTWNAATFILQLILFVTDSQIQAKFKIDGLEYKIGPYIWTTIASTSDSLTSVTFPPLSDSEFQLFPSTSRSRWLHKKGSVYIVPHRLRVKLESVYFPFFFFFFYSIYLKYTNRITGKCSDNENAKEKLYMYVPVTSNFMQGVFLPSLCLVLSDTFIGPANGCCGRVVICLLPLFSCSCRYRYSIWLQHNQNSISSVLRLDLYIKQPVIPFKNFPWCVTNTSLTIPLSLIKQQNAQTVA